METEAQKGETILKTPSHDFGGHEVSDSQPEKPGRNMFKPPRNTRYEQGSGEGTLVHNRHDFLSAGYFEGQYFSGAPSDKTQPAMLKEPWPYIESSIMGVPGVSTAQCRDSPFPRNQKGDE